ncbi:MAG TPA: CpaF family protein [Baekduia sp.]|uniref:CpaF family protein n=1 Tax=Baekduia sp. TaxID=2600305 RepID=UPI002B82CED6|nr:CpaF family protein [Baekduia sp.]HMJ32744.1 CpaF family protein [Baekduia sp.]
MDLQERLAGRGVVDDAAADPFVEVKNRIHLAVVGDLGPQLFNADTRPAALRERVLADIRGHLEQESGLARTDRERLTGEIADDILGHGPLERLLADDSVTEIMVNGPYDIWVERKGRLHETDARFSDESHLRRIINKMVAVVGRRIDESSPMVDARLPDGSRVNAIIPPLSLIGPLVTIRKFSKQRLDPGDLVRIGTLSAETVEFIERCVEAELNILISGGTGSGKTTLLNALSTAVPESERIVTIEDAAELRLNQRHVLRLEARPKNIEGQGEISIRELLRNSLRMRPDRIIVGEVRGAETLDMLQAMNTGHDGSMSTIHANSPRDALARIETMVLMAGYDLPVKAIRQQVASALDLIIHLERLQDGSRRVTAITEVGRMESDVITLSELFRFTIDHFEADRTVVGSLNATGLRPTFVDKFERHGITLPMQLFVARPDFLRGAQA